MDDQTFHQLLGPEPTPAAPAPAPGQGPSDPAQQQPQAVAPQAPLEPNGLEGETVTGAIPKVDGLPDDEPGLSDPTKTMLDAPLAGAAESIFQTKDFLAGETKEDDKSQLRKNAEHAGDGEGMGFALTKGVAQFATGLLGAGKLVKAAEGIGAVGSGLSALRAAKGGEMALESAKAAAVGGIAFDPHTERLSNLIQSAPVLANPVTQFLAAKPDDSAAAGRFKNALESLGMDAALIGVVGGSVKAYRAVSDWRGGTGGAEAVVKASDELDAAMDQHNDIKAAQEGYGQAPEATQVQAPKDAEGTPVEVPGVPLKQFSEDSSGHVVAYHGSPHDFDKFDVSKIGTGEGQQAYGRGLYFAENEKVAKGYRDDLSEGSQDIEVGGKPFDYEAASRDEQKAFDSLFKGDTWRANLPGAIQQAERRVGMFPEGDALRANAQKQLDILKGWEQDGLKDTGGSKGSLYQVRINRPNEHFVDWDLPLDEQSQHVQDTIAGLRETDPRIAGTFRKHGQESAGSAFRRLQPEDSAALHKAGIAGIKYLDGGSRGMGDGTRNFVVFHHDDVAITHKNGEAHTDLSGREFTKASPEQPWVASSPAPSRLAQMVEDAKATPNRLVSQLAEDAKAGEEPAAGAKPEPQDGIKVDQVKSPTQGAGEDGLPARPKLSVVSPEEAHSIFAGVSSDIDALSVHGDWDTAVANGHIFGKGGSLPYQKLVGGESGKGGLDALVTAVADELKPQFDAAKGGDILTDARVQKMIQQRYKLYGEDPAATMGLLQRAGKDANAMVANMEASFGIAQRGYQDAFTLASRIRMGDLSGFDSEAAAMEGLRQRIETASSAWTSGQAMRAASGRALRRMRGEFRLQQADVDALKGMDGNELVELLNTTGGDPRSIKTALQPGLLSQVSDAAHFLYTNNLLWGLRTHFINFSTNFYMVATRPAERILGSLAQSVVAAKTGDQELAQVALDTRRQALRSYAYMGATLHDSWKSALQTFDLGDSIMAPHGDELGTGGSHSLGQQVAQMPWRPWDSIGNVTANALMVAAPKALGLPSRTIGMVDEFIKGISYRSNVQAAAHVEGIEAGLGGDQLTDFVRNRLYGAFDDSGRATDMAALQEAKVATYQQDLVPGTIGAGLQSLTANNAWLRFIVPFVKTPTNVIRMGVKLTPGLNLLQGEYRSMIRGERGAEAQAQAIGQMAMGSLFMGLAAYLHHSGSITGGGPSNPKLKADLRATGWQPYSFVKANADGSKTYIPYGRFDPVAMPFGMVADISDVLHADPDSKAVQKAGNMMLAVGMSLAKSFSEKTYMKSVDDALKFAIDPEHDAARFAGQTTANFIPASSLLRMGNPDPYLRDARSYLDFVKASIPGFSETIPAKRDAFGDFLTVHKGLWVNAPGDIVDSELRRMADQPFGSGNSVGPPSATYRGGIDLRDVKTVDGRNAYDVFQEKARTPTVRSAPIKDVVAKIMQTDAYRNAPDGDAQTKGTKLAIIAKPMTRYRVAATREMLADKNVRDAAYAKQKAAASAYANRPSNTNPTPANSQGAALSKLQGAFSNMLGGGQ